MMFIIALLFTIFALTLGQQNWDRINSHVKFLSAKGDNVVALTPNDHVIQLVNNAWVHIPYNGFRIFHIAAAQDGSFYAVGVEHNLWRYNTATKDWSALTSGDNLGTINAQDKTNAVYTTLLGGNVGKFNAGNLAPIGGSAAVGGSLNRDVAIGTDGSIFKITEDGVLSKFSAGAFNPVTLDPNIGEPVQVDVHSANRLVILDYTRTPFLYDGTTWTNIGGGFECLEVTVGTSKVYCVDPHGCVRSLTI